MLVFDTWIDNQDRINNGNLLAAEDPDRKVSVRYAYIDYGNSLTCGWKDGPAPTVGRPVGPYPVQVNPDGSAIGKTIAAIEALSHGHIGEVVDRIPEAFINTQRRSAIATDPACVRCC